MFPYPLSYYEFFVKFNEGDYYTCHDLLEEIWLTEKDNLYLKGLLQMCVSLYHYSYGNVKGCREMMKAANHYLSNYRPFFWGVNIDHVLDYVQQCLTIIPQDIERVPFEEQATLPILPELILVLHEES